MKIKYIIIALIATVSISAKAESIFTQCDTCSTSSSFYDVAAYVGENKSGGSNIVYVANFNSEEIHKYKVIFIKSFEPGISDELIVAELDLTPEDINAKNNIFYNMYSLRTLEYDVPAGVAQSAYDMIGSSSTKNNVESSYVSNQSILRRINDVVVGALQIAGKVVDFRAVVSVGFSDGSVATFQLTGINADINVELDLLGVVDADNNDVPLTVDDMKTNGAMNFSSQGQIGVQRYIDAMIRSGIKVETNMGGGSGGVMVCQGNSSGGLTCVLK